MKKNHLILGSSPNAITRGSYAVSPHLRCCQVEAQAHVNRERHYAGDHYHNGGHSNGDALKVPCFFQYPTLLLSDFYGKAIHPQSKSKHTLGYCSPPPKKNQVSTTFSLKDRACYVAQVVLKWKLSFHSPPRAMMLGYTQVFK